MTDEFEVEREGRRPFRFLIKLATFLGLVYVAGRFIAQKKDEYAGLTESEARERLVEKIKPKLGDDTAEEIADQVIPKLKERGFLKSGPIEDATDKVEKTARKKTDAAKAKTEEASDKVAEAVDKVVKD
jgi:DNA-directed RNA polymerase specialized sigma54-like protein